MKFLCLQLAEYPEYLEMRAGGKDQKISEKLNFKAGIALEMLNK